MPGHETSRDEGKQGQAVILFKFERSRILAYRNSIVKNKSIIANYGNGRFLGAAESVRCIEGFWNAKFSLGALLFDTVKWADMWSWCDYEIKQQDWIGQADEHLVPLACIYPEQCGYNVMVLTDLAGNDAETFDSCYKQHHQDVVTKHGGISEVACTNHTKKIRGTQSLGTVIIDLFPSEEAFDQFYTSECFKKLQDLRQNFATSDVLVMKLEMDFC